MPVWLSVQNVPELIAFIKTRTTQEIHELIVADIEFWKAEGCRAIDHMMEDWFMERGGSPKWWTKVVVFGHLPEDSDTHQYLGPWEIGEELMAEVREVVS